MDDLVKTGGECVIWVVDLVNVVYIGMREESEMCWPRRWRRGGGDGLPYHSRIPGLYGSPSTILSHLIICSPFDNNRRVDAFFQGDSLTDKDQVKSVSFSVGAKMCVLDHF